MNVPDDVNNPDPLDPPLGDDDPSGEHRDDSGLRGVIPELEGQQPM